MRRFRSLVSVVTRKRFTLLRRYPINTASDIVLMYVFFAVVFFGGRSLVGAAITDSLPGIIVGFFLLTMASIAYSKTSWDLIHEAQWGTLEQLFMSPFGFDVVVIVKSVVNVFVTFGYGVVILALMMVTSGRMLSLDIVTILPVSVLSLATTIGIGYALGGLALVYKRIESTFQIVQFAFLGFIAVPVEGSFWLKLLPLTLGTSLLERAMGDGYRLWQLDSGDLALLCAKAVAYLLIGFVLFRYGSQRARAEGTLGHY